VVAGRFKTVFPGKKKVSQKRNIFSLTFLVPLERASTAAMVCKNVRKVKESNGSVTHVFHFILQYLQIQVEASGFQDELFQNGRKLCIDKFTSDFYPSFSTRYNPRK
jgi:hypothetical protein